MDTKQIENTNRHVDRLVPIKVLKIIISLLNLCSSFVIEHYIYNIRCLISIFLIPYISCFFMVWWCNKMTNHSRRKDKIPVKLPQSAEQQLR